LHNIKIFSEELFFKEINTIIASPALLINPKIFDLKSIGENDIDLKTLPSTELHPAAQRYFFTRQNKYIRAAYDHRVKIGDSSVQHPAFFTADFERQPERHSAVALSIAKIITAQRHEGVIFRSKNNIHRIHAEPLEDKITHVETNKIQHNGTKVRFNEHQLLSFEKSECGLLGRVTVLSIKLTQLPTMKVFEKNSPFIIMNCGEWKFSTETSSFSGFIFPKFCFF
jgi:hypothetical protein